GHAARPAPADRAARYHVGDHGQLLDRDQFPGEVAALHKVALGHHGHHAGLQPAQLAGDEPVATTDLLVGGDAQADHVDLAPGVPYQVVEPLPEQRTGTVQAGRVDEHELGVGPVQHPADHVPGGLRPGRGDRDLLPDQRV